MNTIYDDVLKMMDDYSEGSTENRADGVLRKELAREISDKFERFIEWVAANCVKLWNMENVYQEIETHKTFKGTGNLFQYWIDNIDKKK